jgi:hypothetical protein
LRLLNRSYLSVRPRSNKFHCEQRFGLFSVVIDESTVM